MYCKLFLLDFIRIRIHRNCSDSADPDPQPASQLRSDYQGRDEEGVSLQGGRIRGCSQLAVTHLD